MSWTTADEARAHLCPVLERRCVADQCMAWDRGYKAGDGRCALTAAGVAAASLTRALAVASTFARLPGPAGRIRLAIATAELALVEARHGLERAILDSTPDMPDAELGDLLSLLADRGPLPNAVAGGAGRSPAGGVGNTPPAKCTGEEKPKEIKPMAEHAALVGGGTRGLEDSPLAPPRFPIGCKVELLDGRIATVRHQKGFAVGVELPDGRIVDAPRRSLRMLVAA